MYSVIRIGNCFVIVDSDTQIKRVLKPEKTRRVISMDGNDADFRDVKKGAAQFGTAPGYRVLSAMILRICFARIAERMRKHRLP